LKYKLFEILNIYNINFPKILIIITDVSFSEKDYLKLDIFFKSIFSFVQDNFPSMSDPSSTIKILSKNDDFKTFLQRFTKFKDIEITDNMNVAIDGLLNISVEKLINVGYDGIKQSLIEKKEQTECNTEMIELKFQEDKIVREEKDITIAVVDDDKVIINFIEIVFRNTKCRLKTYSDGDSFIKDLVNGLPDLLFLDIMMPKMSGIEVIKYLHTYKILNKFQTIVLSASLNEDIIEMIKKYGVNNYVVKTKQNMGFVIKKAYEILKKIKCNDTMEHKTLPDRKYKISIVDDDKVTLEFLKLLFSNQFKVNGYNSGQAFLDDLPNNKPDLIFLDLLMPGITGFEVLKYFKEKNIDIPVIVFSAMGQKETIQKAMDFGIKHYIVKPPANPEILISKATEVLNSQF